MNPSQKKLLFILAATLGAYALYAIARAFIAGEKTLAGLILAPFAGIAAVFHSVAGLFTGGTPDDPKAVNLDAAAAGLTNLDGTPITNEQASAAVSGYSLPGAWDSPLNADGSFQIFKP